MPQCGAVLQALSGDSVRTLFLQGLSASAAPVLFSAIAEKLRKTVVFILQDADEAGYFYHDLTQIMGQDDVLFFPSSYRRAVKYGQRDAANEILRTEVLSRLSRRKEGKRTSLYIVSCPEAVSELVVSKTRLDERTLTLTAGQTVDLVEIQRMLREFGFSEVDYVYEPGQFAVRGSIMDVYSFSSEWPFRIDFFGNEIETIRTFEVQDQLSRDRRDTVEIVPELTRTADEKMPFTSFLPPDTLLVVKDMLYLRETVGRIYQEGFSSQAMTERLEGATEAEQAEIMRDMRRDNQLVSGTRFSEEMSSFRRIEIGHNATGTPDATISFNITPQPLFHKNFDLLTRSLEDYRLMGYKLYILADSEKQTKRLRDIFASDEIKARDYDIKFEPVDRTLHEGFADNDLRACFFTDHQIFDRFHKYSLRSDTARSGKMALTMKELQEMEPGDFIVHVDFGIGKFGQSACRRHIQGGNTHHLSARRHCGCVYTLALQNIKIPSQRSRRPSTPEHPRHRSVGTSERTYQETHKRHSARSDKALCQTPS